MKFRLTLPLSVTAAQSKSVPSVRFYRLKNQFVAQVGLSQLPKHPADHKQPYDQENQNFRKADGSHRRSLAFRESPRP